MTTNTWRNLGHTSNVEAVLSYTHEDMEHILYIPAASMNGITMSVESTEVPLTTLKLMFGNYQLKRAPISTARVRVVKEVFLVELTKESFENAVNGLMRGRRAELPVAIEKAYGGYLIRVEYYE